MPPQQLDPRRASASRNLLLVQIMDWMGDTVQSILSAGADDWIRGEPQSMTTQLSDYLHSPQVIVVGSIGDPAAGIGKMKRATMLQYGTA